MAEGLTGMLGGLLGGSGGNVAQSLLKLAQSQGGGLGGLVSKFTGSGDAAVAGKAQSWVGTGANEPISGEQVEHTLGSDTVAQVAQDAGVSHEDAKSQLAKLVPSLVDKLSPDGKLPDLSGLSGSLGKLLGGLGR
jgi:uncharacterized protein YidB (DUF937 family)